MSQIEKYEFTFRECFAEFFGILTLVYFSGWLSILYLNDKIFTPEIALSSAAIYAFLIWSSISFSKAQFNPAITIAQVLTKKMSSFNAMVVVTS
jgi:glycerol uptake facilitator-like aquaporin